MLGQCGAIVEFNPNQLSADVTQRLLLLPMLRRVRWGTAIAPKDSVSKRNR